MVTVLHGSEVESSGSRTVWEALAKVPGIDLSIESTGRKQVVVRGIGRTYASGNVKILLNGNSMNSAEIANANPALNIPIEQVDRIEVIRGPGSALYGEFAYTGVINIITHSDKKRLFLRAADGQHRGGGGIYSYRAPDSDLAIDLNLGHWREDGQEVWVDEDTLYSKGIPQYSNAPGPSNEAQENSTLFLNIEKNGYKASIQLLEGGNGDHFGINEYLPPDEGSIIDSQRYKNVRLEKGLSGGAVKEARIHTSWLRIKEDKEGLFTCTPGNSYPLSDGDEDFCDTDYYSWDTSQPILTDKRHIEERSTAGFEIGWQETGGHTPFLAYEFSYIEVKKNTVESGQKGLYTEHYSLITPGKSRRINSLTLQDEYRPSESLTITAGLRHDHYSDIGGSTTPRLAAVYRLGRQHIFKAQYARAFRPPTFQEIGGAVDTIDPAKLESYEAGYLFKGIDNDLRLTLFHSTLKKPIAFVETATTLGYVNTDDSVLYGIEAEWEHRFEYNLDVNGNISYLQTEDNNTGESVSGSSDWLANLGLNYRPDGSSHINLQYRYTGDIHRSIDDTRSMLDGYSTLDATYNYTPPSKYSLRIGIKNILDSDVVYPAPMETYPEDRPRQGRLWWAGMSYQL
ncbi:MAG: TonB-dependent receptor [Gammaproteobacteria bacterium]|nr:TonB-dependent receptor [Gammaproteobacteria bacterium]MCW8841172.1 TonB-dependent receptor [Gammaproteobacteria bacterium]MCW8958849.1 TonB-dependent receptor [Gammaproteobacteria bacterium]MCW8971668.1 TonB-dependent receptor [Gammaproteobacteria bacterium]MCW8993427.1 TonB-dependent receptor [Gammaproteobacteria bacterium]